MTANSRPYPRKADPPQKGTDPPEQPGPIGGLGHIIVIPHAIPFSKENEKAPQKGGPTHYNGGRDILGVNALSSTLRTKLAQQTHPPEGEAYLNGVAPPPGHSVWGVLSLGGRNPWLSAAQDLLAECCDLPAITVLSRIQYPPVQGSFTGTASIPTASVTVPGIRCPHPRSRLRVGHHRTHAGSHDDAADATQSEHRENRILQIDPFALVLLIRFLRITRAVPGCGG